VLQLPQAPLVQLLRALDLLVQDLQELLLLERDQLA
jgi:hypothetical protein